MVGWDQELAKGTTISLYMELRQRHIVSAAAMHGEILML